MGGGGGGHHGYSLLHQFLCEKTPASADRQKTQWIARALSFDLSHSAVFPQLTCVCWALISTADRRCWSISLFPSYLSTFTFCLIRQPHGGVYCSKETWLDTLRRFAESLVQKIIISLRTPQLPIWWVSVLQSELSLLYEVRGRRDENIAFFFSANLGICL